MSRNGYVTLDDFLAGITATPVDLRVPGLGIVQVRGLTVLESQELEAYRGKDKEILVQTVVRGLVAPRLTQDNVEALTHASVAKVRIMAERILELSAQGDAEETEKKAGGGS